MKEKTNLTKMAMTVVATKTVISPVLNQFLNAFKNGHNCDARIYFREMFCLHRVTLIMAPH
jgi:hypothetical protein